RVLAKVWRAPIHTVTGGLRPPERSFFRWTALGLGSRAGANHLRKLRKTSDARRSLEVACAAGHSRGTVPRRIPLRERATPRVDQPHSPRGSAEHSRRNGKRLPLLFRRLREHSQPLHAFLHGRDRPGPPTDRLSVNPALCPRDLGPNLGTL